MNDEQTPPATEPAPLNPVSHLLTQLSRVFTAVPQTVEDQRSAYIMALVEMARFVHRVSCQRPRCQARPRAQDRC
jgi:hypothetical protein